MAHNGTYGYHVGETINGTTSGSYRILSSSGATSQASGTVYDTSYFDSISQKTYTPVYDLYASYGYKSGTNGLNQDFDYVFAVGQYHPFGDRGPMRRRSALPPRPSTISNSPIQTRTTISAPWPTTAHTVIMSARPSTGRPAASTTSCRHPAR